jgi:hypothetical protein
VTHNVLGALNVKADGVAAQRMNRGIGFGMVSTRTLRATYLFAQRPEISVIRGRMRRVDVQGGT